MAKPQYRFLTNEPTENDILMDRYFLYIDILGFADLVLNEPERVKDLYEIISTLNVHRHESFGTIVFSDTILVYPKIERNIGRQTDAYFVMYLCEFAQDLLYRLANRNIWFRAILTQGKFTHYLLNEIPCYYGPALVEAYLGDKKGNLDAVGLFMDRRCTQRSTVFDSASFNGRYDFVYLWQSLDDFEPNGLYSFPFENALEVSEADLQWKLAQDALMLRNIARNRAATDDRVAQKHKNTWKLLHARYGKILDALEADNFNPRVFCPKYDWTAAIERAGSR